jgi:hypothetical protein
MTILGDKDVLFNLQEHTISSTLVRDFNTVCEGCKQFRDYAIEG